MDDDAHQEPDNLGPLLVGKAGVQAGPNLGKEVVGFLGQDIAAGGPCGGHAGFQCRSFSLDAVKFDI